MGCGYTKQDAKIETIEELYDAYDKGEFVYDELAYKLLQVKDGQAIGDLFKDITACPVVNNDVCKVYHEIVVYGFHPEKGHEAYTLRVCPNKFSSMEQCPLSKEKENEQA